MQRDVDVLICVHFLGIYDFFIVECSSELFLLASLDLHLTACLYMSSFSCGKDIDKSCLNLEWTNIKSGFTRMKN